MRDFVGCSYAAKCPFVGSTWKHNNQSKTACLKVFPMNYLFAKIVNHDQLKGVFVLRVSNLSKS